MDVRCCAYYRKDTTRSASIVRELGTVGRQWSYPGYTVDRTPYGVCSMSSAITST
jgi:hypothetical protein